MAKETGISTLVGVIILIAVAVVAFGGVFGYQYLTQPKEDPAVENNQPIVGGDKDAHGCIPSAGYSWCEIKQKCLRVWEEPCVADQTAGWQTYTNAEYGFEFKYDPKYKLVENFNRITGPDDKIGQSDIQIGDFKDAPTMTYDWYQVTIKKAIYSLEELKSFYMKPSLMSNISPTTKLTFAGQEAIGMKFYQEVGAGFYVNAVGIVKNGTAFIISKWNEYDKSSEVEFNQILATFKFTK